MRLLRLGIEDQGRDRANFIFAIRQILTCYKIEVNKVFFRLFINLSPFSKGGLRGISNPSQSPFQKGEEVLA